MICNHLLAVRFCQGAPDIDRNAQRCAAGLLIRVSQVRSLIGQPDISRWCNGSTTVSKTVCGGSSPSREANHSEVAEWSKATACKAAQPWVRIPPSLPPWGCSANGNTPVLQAGIESSILSISTIPTRIGITGSPPALGAGRCRFESCVRDQSHSNADTAL